MTLEDDIAQTFKENNWSWKTKNGREVPGAYEIEQALDECVRLLYAEKPGAQLEVGRLIVKKLHRGYDVYVLAGYYE